ncbi:MAG: transposase [Acinetobacter sp.]
MQESVTGEYFYAYVMGVAKQIKEIQHPLTLIVDNASIHKAKKCRHGRDLLEQDFNVRLYFLPPYSPELNRIEMLWRSMKYQWREFKWMPTNEKKKKRKKGERLYNG